MNDWARDTTEEVLLAIQEWRDAFPHKLILDEIGRLKAERQRLVLEIEEVSTARDEAFDLRKASNVDASQEPS